MTGATGGCGCGCCAGVEPVTPVQVTNRPGLDAVSYRVGTHPQFLESMLARLSEVRVEDRHGRGARPLVALTTRAPDDPALAILDGCAAVADVLTFYQERIANEGFLRCATEDRSIRELGRLVGYEPRPGVAATTYLAYTADAEARLTVHAGSRVQSVPGPGELPQTFETNDDLEARGEWNTLEVRRTHGHHAALLTAATRSGPTGSAAPVYLAGIITGLTAGDPLLVDFGAYQELLRVVDVTPEPAADRTRVAVQPWMPPVPPPPPGASPQPVPDPDEVRAVIVRHGDLAAFRVDPARSTARDVVAQLERLETDLLLGMDGPELLEFVRDRTLPALRSELRDLGRRTGPLRRWVGSLVGALEGVVARAEAAAAQPPARASRVAPPRPADSAADSAADADADADGATTIGGALASLAKPPSVPPADPRQLARDVTTGFAAGSDALPGLLTALRPDLGATLYRAWRAAPVTPAATVRVYALRQRAAAFGHNAAPEPLRDRNGVVTGSREWLLTKPFGVAPEEFEVSVALPAGRIVDPDPDDQATVEVRIGDGPAAVRASSEFPLTQLLDGPVPLPVPAAGEQVVVALRTPGVSPQTPAGLTVTFESRGMVFDTAVDPGSRSRPRAQLRWTSEGSDPTSVSYLVERNLVDETPDPRSAHVRVQITGTRTGAADVRPTEAATVVSLDTTYPTITPGGWIVLDRPTADPPARRLVIARVTDVREESRSDYGSTGRSTLVDLDREWLDLDTDEFGVIRSTSVFARTELLELADAPLDPVADAVRGSEIPLLELYDGLAPGRWLLVRGERTDVTASRTGGSPPGAGSDVGIPGVVVTELTMLAGVRQDFDPAEPGARTRTTLLLATPLAYSYRRDTVEVFGNVVEATHGETTTEVLGSGDGNRPNQSFPLARRPLTYVSAPSSSGVASTLDVSVDGVRWQEIDSLLGLLPTAHRFVTRTSAEGVTSVTFGDGIEGARLPTGSENVRAEYRFGIGAAGNVDAARITLLTTRPQGVMAVVNPVRASGGADPESGDESRRRIPLGVTALDRVVSTSDYADFALGFAAVGKAAVAVLSEGRTRLVHLTVAGAGDAPLDPTSAAYRNLRSALAAFGDPYQPFRIDVRRLLALVVQVRVAVAPDHLWDVVEPRIRATLLDRFGFARRDLAQDVTRGEVIAAVQTVPGVRFVDLDRLDAVDEETVRAALTDAADTGIGDHLRLRHRVVAHPARRVGTPPRIAPAELAVLLPDASAATLILTEIPG